MTQHEEVFFAAVGCMDGRVQDVIAAFGQQKFNAQYPDTITDAGLVGKLSKAEPSLIEGIRFKVMDVSLGKHQAKGIVVHGHAECAGNPVPDDKHIQDIRESVLVMKSLAGDAIPVVGVFVHRDSSEPSHWIAEEV